jgi:hypothetical protein
VAAAKPRQKKEDRPMEDQPFQDETPRDEDAEMGPEEPGPISEKKLAANRRNALKSTGPVSEEGKRISAMNALRHGLLAREVVIKLGDYQEDECEWLEFLDSVWSRRRPVGAEEEFEVQTIAACHWWQLRCARYLNAVTRKRTLGMRRREARRRDDGFKDVDRFTTSYLEETARGLEHVIAVMEEVKEHLQGEEQIEKLLKGDDVSEELKESLDWLADRYPEDFAPADDDAFKGLTMLRGGEPTVLMNREYVQQVSAGIDTQLSRLTVLRREAARLEELELQAKIETMILPTKVLDNVTRFAAAKTRELEKAEARLDVLQERRRASAKIWPEGHS